MIVPAVAGQGTAPSEALVSDNIQTGLAILKSGKLTQVQRGAQFEAFLLGVTDLKRVSAFVLGSYGPKAAPAERDAFAAAFQSYAVAVYRSFLGKYAGQTLKVTGSRQNAPGDDIVTTTLVDPDDRGGQPLEIDFRVRSDTGKPAIVDFAVGGIWLALEERDQFVAFLGQNGGSVPALIAHLDALRAKIGDGS
ncbi:MAG TPA: ABC transporter substrate-binding protein [Rhizomicrobium sp.]